jgi:hypothetical protein
MGFRAFSRVVASTVSLSAVIVCSASTLGATKKTYPAKNEEEVEVLSLILTSEMKANKWTKKEVICFSVNGQDPSPKSVKSLQHRGLNVRSSAEWTKKFNCGFEVQMEYSGLDSQSAKVRSKVVDLREINTGQGDLALLQKDGEYLLKKENAKWSISGYLSIAPASWHKVDAGPFSILAPSAWEFHQLEGVDSFVGEFVGDGITLRFDFGGYPNRLKEEKKPAYVVVHKSIGGFRAKVVSPRTPGHGITGVYFRNVGHATALCLWGKDLTSTQQELALKIFGTLRFGGPLPRYVLPPPPPTKNV